MLNQILAITKCTRVLVPGVQIQKTESSWVVLRVAKQLFVKQRSTTQIRMVAITVRTPATLHSVALVRR